MATLKIRNIMIRCILFNSAHKNTSKVFGKKGSLSLKYIFLPKSKSLRSENLATCQLIYVQVDIDKFASVYQV